MSSHAPTGTQHDFFDYTSGRWLWNEEARLRGRYRRFNFHELQNVAAKSIGAERCVLMTKLAEGGFNRVFRLVMDDGSAVIARIPTLNTDSPRLTIASEVATMDFALSILGLPVPKVLAWSMEADNPVHCEYIVMEEAAGTHLSEIWDNLSIDAKADIVHELVKVETKLLSVSFTRHGSLYFAHHNFPGCIKAQAEGELPASLIAEIEKRYVIGPVADRGFWDGERKNMFIDRGPWKRHQDYLKAIARREKTWLRECAPHPRGGSGIFSIKTESQRSLEAHLALYDKFEDVAENLLPRSGPPVRATVWHWDLRISNLFVDSSKITGIIDWQDIWAGPLFIQARKPRLVAYHGDIMLRLPPHYSTLEDEEEKARLSSQVEKSTLLWIYENDTKNANPLLHEVYNFPHLRTRQDVVRFSTNTWDGDIVPFRESLIRVQRYWDRICPDQPCPIVFTKADIKAHLDEAEGWNEVADFWDSVAHLVMRDGWTFHETYEEAMALFAQLREEGLKQLDGGERDRFEEQTRWADKTNKRDE